MLCAQGLQAYRFLIKKLSFYTPIKPRRFSKILKLKFLQFIFQLHMFSPSQNRYFNAKTNAILEVSLCTF